MIHCLIFQDLFLLSLQIMWLLFPNAISIRSANWIHCIESYSDSIFTNQTIYCYLTDPTSRTDVFEMTNLIAEFRNSLQQISFFDDMIIIYSVDSSHSIVKFSTIWKFISQQRCSLLKLHLNLCWHESLNLEECKLTKWDLKFDNLMGWATIWLRKTAARTNEWRPWGSESVLCTRRSNTTTNISGLMSILFDLAVGNVKSSRPRHCVFSCIQETRSAKFRPEFSFHNIFDSLRCQIRASPDWTARNRK
jgi:hypothetical protein